MPSKPLTREQEARKVADTWYAREQILGWLTRDRITVKDREALADFCTEHFRLAFVKGCQLDPEAVSLRAQLAAAHQRIADYRGVGVDSSRQGVSA